VQTQTPFRRTVQSRTITTSIAWRSLRNHRAATCSRRYVHSRLARAGHPALCVLACQSRGGDVPTSVVRSIAKRSLLGGALADICTSAGPSPTSLCLLAGSRCVTRPPGYGYSVFADARLVHALSDQWKLHSIPGLPRLVWSVQHVKTLRSCRHWRPATSQNLRVSSIYATERRCRVSTSEPLP
jgi:hypothetical protein